LPSLFWSPQNTSSARMTPQSQSWQTCSASLPTWCVHFSSYWTMCSTVLH